MPKYRNQTSQNKNRWAKKKALISISIQYIEYFQQNVKAPPLKALVQRYIHSLLQSVSLVEKWLKKLDAYGRFGSAAWVWRVCMAVTQ